MSGVQVTDVGPVYDVAIGTDAASMVGYVLAPNATWEESTDIQDEEHLVQVSTNQTDRFQRYPRVSQGSWHNGEGQVTFVDAARYFTSIGLETAKDASLGLWAAEYDFSATLNLSHTVVGRENLPFVTDGVGNWFLGCSALGGNPGLLINGVPFTITGNPEVFDLLSCPQNQFAATANGIYEIQAPYTSPTFVQWSATVPANTGDGTMAYFNGGLYFVDSTRHLIKKLTAISTETTAFTLTPMEAAGIHCLASTASGLIFATGPQNSVVFGNISVLYTFDGTNATRIADFNGCVHAILEMGGVTYILVEEMGSVSLLGGFGRQSTLYSLVGTSLTLITDFRFALPALQNQVVGNNPPGAGVPYHHSLAKDERYLFVAMCGYPLLRYDPVNQAFARVGNPWPDTRPSPGIMYAHRVGVSTVLIPSSPFNFQPILYQLQVYNDISGNVAPKWAVWSSLVVTSLSQLVTPASGTITTSFFDFGVPDVVKAMRSIEIDLLGFVAGGGTTISCSYLLDDQTTFTALPLTFIVQGSSGVLRGLLPAGTFARRIQFQITLSQDFSVSLSKPFIRSYSVLANLGRVWHTTVACRAHQQSRGGGDDPQRLRGMDLLANIQNAYTQAAGNVVLVVPDPTAKDGASQVNAIIQDYKRITVGGPGLRTEEDGGWDMQSDVELTLTEALP